MRVWRERKYYFAMRKESKVEEHKFTKNYNITDPVMVNWA